MIISQSSMCIILVQIHTPALSLQKHVEHTSGREMVKQQKLNRYHPAFVPPAWILSWDFILAFHLIHLALQ